MIGLAFACLIPLAAIGSIAVGLVAWAAHLGEKSAGAFA